MTAFKTSGSSVNDHVVHIWHVFAKYRTVLILIYHYYTVILMRKSVTLMRKSFCYFIVLLLFCFSSQAYPQSLRQKDQTLMKEKEIFLRNLADYPADSTIVFSLSNYFDVEVNNIYAGIRKDRSLKGEEKAKAVRSLVYFLKELDRSLALRKFDIYEIHGALRSYKTVLNALLSTKPLAPLFEPMRPELSQLMAAAFSQYKESSLLNDIAVYKRVASSPEFILQYVENKPAFRYSDSLLIDAAANDPLKIVYYLNRDKPGVQEKIRNTGNIYLKQIASLSQDKYASELLPFVVQIAENKISPKEILETRTDPSRYFQLLVNTLNESLVSGRSGEIFLKPLRAGIKQKALAFYVNEINALHDAAESARFSSVRNLRPQDIYYIITSCEEELYTSSYLGLYKRLKARFAAPGVDSIFDIVQYDNFHHFLRMASNYNVLADFLNHMLVDKAKIFLKRFIAGIGEDNADGLGRAMDIGDSFGALSAAPEFILYTDTVLRSGLSQSREKNQYRGVRLYNILLQVVELVKQDGSLTRLWSKLGGNYEELMYKELVNDKGEIIELVLFYGDDDGVASFANFLRSYADSNKWKVVKNNNWVSIRSVSENPLIIYANLPLDISEGKDIAAQDSLFAFMEERSQRPSILVHRGHSYHLDKTLNRLQPSVSLAILGSCGSYNKAISIAHFNPNVQVIGSKKTGSKSINDPILDVINQSLVEGKNLYWPVIWKQLENRFSKNEAALELFSEYFPPNHNLSLFVLKLYSTADHRAALKAPNLYYMNAVR